MPEQDLPAGGTSWEKLNEQAPEILLDVSPDENFAALRTRYQAGAAVWSADTHRLAWRREGTNALCWTADGTEVLLMREEYYHRPESHQAGTIRIVSPLQSEYTHFFERYGWPSGEMREGVEIILPTGWVTDVVAAPSRKLAALIWHDQTEAGIELVSWEEGALRQVSNAGYFGDSCILAPPTFSPDGRFIALSYGNDVWWINDEDIEDSPEDYLETPARGGETVCGELVIGDLDAGTYRSEALSVNLPEGWTPDDASKASYYFVGRPVFRDAETVSVSLDGFGEREFSVRPQETGR